MAAQVHFCGIEVAPTEVRVTLLRRDGVLITSHREPLTPDEEGPESFTFSPLRWARLAGEAVQELVEMSGIPTIRIWGLAPVAPPGWICLDADLKPMSELVLAKAPLRGRVHENLSAYLAEDGRRAAHVGLVLAPKDFLRFHWSKVIATDESDATGFGFLSEGKTDWDRAELAARDLTASWFAPVFPSAFACGRVGPDGAVATGLASEAWIAAGCTSTPARVAGCSYLDEPAVYVFADEADVCYWHETREEGVPGEPDVTGQAVIASSPIDSAPPDVLTPETPLILDWLEGEDPAPLLTWADESGRPLFRSPFAGRCGPGAAVVAALASGAYASYEAFYRRYPMPLPIERPIDLDALAGEDEPEENTEHEEF